MPARGRLPNSWGRDERNENEEERMRMIVEAPQAKLETPPSFLDPQDPLLIASVHPHGCPSTGLRTLRGHGQHPPAPGSHPNPASDSRLGLSQALNERRQQHLDSAREKGDWRTDHCPREPPFSCLQSEV